MFGADFSVGAQRVAVLSGVWCAARPTDRACVVRAAPRRSALIAAKAKLLAAADSALW
jgi:hypothetical protein